MQFNKSLLLLSLLSVSLSAHAEFTTYNYTNEESAVKVTSGLVKACSGPAVVTHKQDPNGNPGHYTAKKTTINSLCAGSGSVCTAEIYNNDTCAGTRIGYASLDMKTQTVLGAKAENARYRFEIDGNGTIFNIRYAK